MRYGSLTPVRSPRPTIRWSAGRRIAIGVGIVTVLALVTVLITAAAGRPRHSPAPASTPTFSASATTPSNPPFAEPAVAAVAAPPATTDPVVFAKAAAKTLWSYDTRAVSQPDQLAGLRRWMTTEARYDDWPSVSVTVPGPALWAQLHANGQHATATIAEGHFPAAFKTALAADPGALATAYIYAVTVSGTQTLYWSGGGAGAEKRQITLAVQCRPGRDCALAGIAPTVAP